MRLIVLLSTILSAGSVYAQTPASEQFLPTRNSRDSYTPAAAFGADVFLVAWQSDRLVVGDLSQGIQFAGDIVACRVSRAGNVIDAQPLVICGAMDLQEKPRVSFGNGVFLVVWQDLRNGKDWDVYAARVTPAGAVLDASGILVSGGGRNQAKPRVAWDGSNFLVVWQDYRSGNKYDVYSSRVSTAGQVLDTAGVLISGYSALPTSHYANPAVASAGQGRAFTLFLGQGVVQGGATRTSAGVFLTNGAPDPALAYAADGSTGLGPSGSNGCVLTLAAGGGVYLAAWRTTSPYGRGNASATANMALFSASGQRVMDLQVAGLHSQRRIVDPDAIWDGTAFLVAWNEQWGDGTGSAPLKYPCDRTFAARISPQGTVLGSVMTISGTWDSPAGQACVASDGAGASLVAYEKRPSSGAVPIQVGFRLLSPASGTPSITTQPANQKVTAGQTATYSVAATGAAPLSYQWRKNAADIAGATSPSYTTPATLTADDGSTFQVVVSNAAGSVLSSLASLTVNSLGGAPTITTQPSSQTVTAGQTATFSVSASGTAPLSYQWQKNGANIAGATGASYTTPATTAADSGSTYRVVVTNSAGSVTSSSATLTVTAPPPPPADSDGDSLPDAWEQTHFGGLTQGAGGDLDGDGATNLQEYQGNSDPMDPASLPSGALPPPWRNQDVGSVGLTGSVSHAGGTFTVKGAGADIWGTADGFQFVYQPLNGDGQITARVQSVQNTNAWAKAGVMIRETLTAGSTNAFLAVTPSNGLVFQRRIVPGDVTASSAGPVLGAPYWVRVARSGSTLTGSASADGVNWTVVGSQAIPMGAGVLVGLAVTSHATGALNTSVFDNVSVTTGGGGAGDADGDGMPDAWEMTNFGNLTQTASGDPDVDGATNLAEYTAGTDPMNAASMPAGGGGAVVSGRDNANGDKCGMGSVSEAQYPNRVWLIALLVGIIFMFVVPGIRRRNAC